MITVTPNRTVSLSKFSFFKLLHLLIRSYQVPVLLICPLALSHFLKFKVCRCFVTFKNVNISYIEHVLFTDSIFRPQSGRLMLQS